MKKMIIILGIIGLVIGGGVAIFSILWELSEIRGACQDCPINFWKNTTSSDMMMITSSGITGMLVGFLIGLVIYKLFKK